MKTHTNRHIIHPAKCLLLLMGLCTLLFACQQDDFNYVSGEEAEDEMAVLTYNVSLNGEAQTRAIGDGQSVDQLLVGVFLDGNFIKTHTFKDRNTKGQFTVSIPLLRQEEYTLVFWAQNKDNGIYTISEDDMQISIDYSQYDGKSLQAATSHYFGDGFARAFDIKYTDKDNKPVHPHQTSWGCTTRMIGGIIMTHGDDRGLVLPPAVAPIQVIIVPIAAHKEGVLEKATEVKNALAAAGIRVKMDDSDQSPGWKFAEYEMKGVPLRIELGPRDIENGQCVAVTRHDGEKHFVSLEGIDTTAKELLEAVRSGMFAKALANRERRTYVCHTLDEVNEALKNGDGFVKGMWCGEEACEDRVKEVTGIGSRCVPLEQEQLGEVCMCCGKPAKKMVLWARAY